jgi:hypothetical protein
MKAQLRRRERFDVTITVNDPTTGITISETIWVHNRILANTHSGSGSRPSETIFMARLTIVTFKLLGRLTRLVEKETKPC